MDSLIQHYVESKFTLELQTTIFEIFQIFDDFDLPDPYSSYLDLINIQSDMDSEELQDNFDKLLRRDIEYILDLHLVYLNTGYTLWNALKILNSILLVQNLEDYTFVLAVFDGEVDDSIIFSELVSNLTEATIFNVLETVKHVDRIFLNRIKKLAEDHFEHDNDHKLKFTDIDKTLIINMKSFKEFCNLDIELIGETLISADVYLDQPIETYIPHIRLFIQNTEVDNLTKAKHILSVIYLTIDGKNNPLITYRKVSSLIFDDLETITSIDRWICLVLTDYLTFLQAKG